MIIKFWPATEKNLVKDHVEPPVPAKREVPRWYVNAPRFFEGDELIIRENGATNTGIKGCMPFYDAMTLGYIVKLHCDVLVESTPDGSFSLKWTSSVAPVTDRPRDLFNSIPNVPGYTKFCFAWDIFYPVNLPEGYSLLLVQPMNRYDLPSYISAGVLDVDQSNGYGVVPFAVKQGFNGVIPAGTPIMQIIPFKRDEWTSEILEEKPEQKIKWTPLNKITGWYKNYVWQRKEFN